MNWGRFFRSIGINLIVTTIGIAISLVLLYIIHLFAYSPIVIALAIMAALIIFVAYLDGTDVY